MRDKHIIAIGVAFAVLVTGAIAYSIGNYAGTPTQLAVGQITDIDHKPRRKCGTTKTSEGKTKDKWCNEEWAVEVRYLDQRDRSTRSRRPEAWQYEGARVKVHYNVGRWDRQIMFNRMTKQ